MHDDRNTPPISGHNHTSLADRDRDLCDIEDEDPDTEHHESDGSKVERRLWLS